MAILFEKIIFYNNNILQQGKKAIKNKEKSYEVIKGQVPILISAPHCVKQMRNGIIKREEGETGAIAQYIAEKTKCYAIYKIYNNNDDANYDIENNPYKEEIIELIEKEKIKLLIDLHGSDYESEFDIEIGTGEGTNIQGKQFIVDELKNSFLKNNIKNITIDKKFKANSEHTISRNISQKAKIPCIQLEINGNYRYIQNIEGIEQFIKSTVNFINKIKEKL